MIKSKPPSAEKEKVVVEIGTSERWDCRSHLLNESSSAIARRQNSALELYESRIRWTERGAFVFGLLTKCCLLLSAASAACLARYAPLPNSDAAMIGALILVDALRPASTFLFTSLMTRNFAQHSQEPKNIIHDGVDHRYACANRLRIMGFVVQFMLIPPSFIFAIAKLTQTSDPRRLFFGLCIVNGVFSFSAWILSLSVFLIFRCRNDQSMLRFYDMLSLAEISCKDRLDFFGFAYTMLGSDYERFVQPEAVVKTHRELIKYLYRHRHGQDFLPTLMDDKDAFVRQAAVNMPGFWADPTKMVGLNRVNLTTQVLTKLADKVGPGQVGWAATNSFGGIARRNPCILTTTNTSNGEPRTSLVKFSSVSRTTNVRVALNIYCNTANHCPDLPICYISSVYCGL